MICKKAAEEGEHVAISIIIEDGNHLDWYRGWFLGWLLGRLLGRLPSWPFDWLNGLGWLDGPPGWLLDRLDRLAGLDWLDWKKQKRVKAIATQIPIANIIDLEKNLKYYRTMLYKNSKANNRATLLLH